MPSEGARRRSQSISLLLLFLMLALSQPAESRDNYPVQDTWPRIQRRGGTATMARDMAPGIGIFEYCEGYPSYTELRVAIDGNSRIHVAMLDSANGDLWYTRVDPWRTWHDPVRLAPPQPEPVMPSHNIAASKVSARVCATWVNSPPGFSQKRGYYRYSTDGGDSWEEPTELGWPPAFNDDTLPSFHMSSLFPLFDDNDGLHIVASVAPFLRDTNFVRPAEIWHWSFGNDSWSRICRSEADSMLAPVGYSALIASRSSLVQGESCEDFICVWEEFDGVNVEPETDLLRADIWWASSHDGGRSWPYKEQMTGPGWSVSYRFPSVAYMAIFGTPDTAPVLCMIDQVAGFFVLAQGSATDNPVVCFRLPVEYPCDYPPTDTIGGTTFDMQHVGPAVRSVCNSPDYGVHGVWSYSTFTSGITFPDLNSRYNFYDYATGEWNWIDPDYMQSGVSIFTQRAVYGGLDVDPSTDVAVTAGLAPAVGMAGKPGLKAEGRGMNRTICSGMLMLPDRQAGDLLDIAGRRVLSLRPGMNDFTRVAPGVYFLRPADGGKRSAVRKVVVQR